MKLENILNKYPLMQYELCDTKELTFSEKVRDICSMECERFGKSWSCPPGVGSVSSCKEKCMEYPYVLIYTTYAEVSDSAVFYEALASRKQHEETTRQILSELRKIGEDCFALSGDSCQICSECAYPNACRHPNEAIACIESYGILVTDIAQKYGIDFYTDSHTVTWFGMIFLKKGFLKNEDE